MAEVIGFSGKPKIADPAGQVTEPLGNLGFEDIGAAFNMRKWLQMACEAQGAKMTGGGFGGGIADISIELESHHYWLTIQAIKR